MNGYGNRRKSWEYAQDDVGDSNAVGPVGIVRAASRKRA
jgi:hypothetical protein